MLSLWEGISKRLDFCDKGGTTTWSEAPAQGIFSTISIIKNKPGLSVEHMFQLCRIVKEGPAPATKAAVNISKKAIEQWQGQSLSGTFITNKYMHRMTSTSVLKCLVD